MLNFGYQEDEHQVAMMEFSIWRRILVYTRPYGKKIGVAVGLSLLISLTSLALPSTICRAHSLLVSRSTRTPPKATARRRCWPPMRFSSG